jgi:hypothetical protein
MVVLMDPQFGIVAVLDALGVSSYSIDEARKFISQKDQLLEELKKLEPEFTAIAKQFLLIPGEDVSPPNITVFGDTLVLDWNTQTVDKSVKLFPIVALYLQHIVVKGMLNGILFRGAISIGEYLSDGKSTILGPAMSDAYSWSEETDWFGVIFTPHFRMVLGYMLENTALTVKTENWCVLYSEVPFHNAKKEFFVISWPALVLAVPTGDSITSYAGLCKILSNKPIPKGTESKYENTLVFFKWYEKNKHTKITT